MAKNKRWTMQDLIDKGYEVQGGAAKIIENKPSKYRNQKIQIDGILFDSKKEGQRYQDLKLLEKYKKITDLKTGEYFHFIINGIKVASYKADFVYMENGNKIVEDVKSPITRKNPVYRLKKKLMKAVHDIEIIET